MKIDNDDPAPVLEKPVRPPSRGEKRRQAHVMRRFIKNLPSDIGPTQKAILELVREKGCLTFDQVAKALGKGRGTIRRAAESLKGKDERVDVFDGRVRWAG